jgi:hypothetical protein
MKTTGQGWTRSWQGPLPRPDGQLTRAAPRRNHALADRDSWIPGEHSLTTARIMSEEGVPMDRVARDESDGFGGRKVGEEADLDAPYGKRSLGATTDSSVVQYAGGGATHPAAVDSAQQGFAGGGSELPHRAAIESSFGVDLGSVRAHAGDAASSACDDLGAQAYTQGSQIAFSSPSPSLHLAAHEAAHVVQQSQGVQLQSATGKVGDQYERQADAAADRVVAGQSARELFPAGADFGGAITDSVGTGGPIQRYHHQEGKKWRVADDGLLAVHQASAYGGQTAYATESAIKSASQQLKAATSTISLKAGSMSSTFQDADGKEHALVDVVPVNSKNNTEDLDMELYADCGRSAHAVSGMDGGTGSGGGSVARYNKDGQSKKGGSSSDWMEIQKVKMMIDLFTTKSKWWQVWKDTYSTKLDVATINAKLQTYNDLKQQWANEVDDDARDVLAGQMGRLAAEMDKLSRAEYEKLDKDAKDDFDKEAGINAHADPAIGEAFHMSTGGKAHPKKPKNVGTWNFHWAGVVLKSGGDTMTLENYSVSDYNVENKEWVFQMYGVGKKGQSFHEEHKDVHKQHGDAPTTMVATRE